ARFDNVFGALWPRIEHAVVLEVRQRPRRSRTMMRDRIFLSYRRSDVPAAVGELHAALAERFGDEVIFQDTKAIGPGEEFPVRLRNELARAAFVLVVIGPHWNEVDVHGARRLSDPRDWVRVEVQTALD